MTDQHMYLTKRVYIANGKVLYLSVVRNDTHEVGKGGDCKYCSISVLVGLCWIGGKGWHALPAMF